MFVHQGTLTFREDVTAGQIDAIAVALLALPDRIDKLHTASVVRDAGLAEGNGHLTFRMSFPDVEAWRAYRTHPAHVSVVKDHIGPVLESKAFLQYEDVDVATTGDDAVTRDAQAAGFGKTLPLGTSPALVVVDPAKAYTDPSSPLYAGVERSVAVMRALRDHAAASGIPVVLTRVRYDNGNQGGLFYDKVASLAYFDAGNPLGEFIDGFEPRLGETVVTKHFPSAFFGTDLAATLHHKGVDTLLIAGLSTSGCVRATALDALQYGFVPVVVREAVGDRNPQAHASNLRDIASKCGEVRGFDEIERYLRQGP